MLSMLSKYLDRNYKGYAHACLAIKQITVQPRYILSRQTSGATLNVGQYLIGYCLSLQKNIRP